MQDPYLATSLAHELRSCTARGLESKSVSARIYIDLPENSEVEQCYETYIALKINAERQKVG